MGKDHKACPYYAATHFAGDAHAVLVDKGIVYTYISNMLADACSCNVLSMFCACRLCTIPGFALHNLGPVAHQPRHQMSFVASAAGTSAIKHSMLNASSNTLGNKPCSHTLCEGWHDWSAPGTGKVAQCKALCAHIRIRRLLCVDCIDWGMLAMQARQTLSSALIATFWIQSYAVQWISLWTSLCSFLMRHTTLKTQQGMLAGNFGFQPDCKVTRKFVFMGNEDVDYPILSRIELIHSVAACQDAT